MSMNLTEKAISMLCSGQVKATDIKPLLQVTDIKLVNSQQQQQNSTDRYRVVLSDGMHLQQGMLATQKNDLVQSGRLQKSSVVQLTQFVCNIVRDRMIIIIIDLDVILQKCDLIGEPKPYTGPLIESASATTSPVPAQSSVDKLNGAGGPMQHPRMDQSYGNPYSNNMDPPRYGATNLASSTYAKNEPISGPTGSAHLGGSYNDQKTRFQNTRPDISQTSVNLHARPPHPVYQQPPPMYGNRGPIAKNEAPLRIIPIAALNPYQGRWTIRARVTAKSELRHYNNPRGDGKVFSFDLLDSDSGEIRVTCFNAVADQFYNQIECGRVYMISKGSLKPAQKNFNHLHNDHEIFLESTSIVQPCFEDDNSIPKQQFHFRTIGDIEGMESNSIVDVIGVVSSITPSSSLMRKNGTETQKRTLHLKDMSGRSVELTLWGNFCNVDGQRLQNICDSGVFPILAVKSGRVSDFNGKVVGTISSSQLFIEPDFLEAHKLKQWFESEGRSTPSVSISREMTSTSRVDSRKTLSQIKDERLGTSEKPDWITVNATISFIKVDNFCYTACPVMIGDRQCNKKVTNNGDGKWRCDRCDQSVVDCDYRYILQFQIQDHTGLTWVTAFQESGEEIMGISAKNLHFMKYEEQDDERFAEVLRSILFTKFVFKLKVKEEMFSDEHRVKSTVVKAEKINYISESRFLLDLINKIRGGDSNPFGPKVENNTPTKLGMTGVRQPSPPVNYYAGREIREAPANQFGQFGNQYSRPPPPANQMGQYGNNQHAISKPQASGPSLYLTCNSCGASGHNSMNCPSVMNGPGQSVGGGYVGRAPSGPSGGGGSGECYKCHQFGHWARDCPGAPAYGNNNGSATGMYGGFPKQRVGGF